MRVLIIDNYDSFTYNLYQYFGEILSTRFGYSHFELAVKRNDEITLGEAEEFNADRIIISPGPGTPSDKNYFGVCSDIITHLGKSTPLLGVCLGMQGIAHCFGGKVVRATLPMHGKTSIICHDGKGVYRNVPQGLEIMRYHSLVVEASSLPDCFEVTSVIADLHQTDRQSLAKLLATGAEIMGIRHRDYPIEGIQYHPESFATEGGKEILTNFIT